jgi:hypothetical protein
MLAVRMCKPDGDLAMVQMDETLRKVMEAAKSLACWTEVEEVSAVARTSEFW